MDVIRDLKFGGVTDQFWWDNGSKSFEVGGVRDVTRTLKFGGTRGSTEHWSLMERGDQHSFEFWWGNGSTEMGT